MIKKYLEVGKVVGTHGIRGEMRVECWANSPDFLRQFKKLYLDGGKTTLDVSCRPHKNIVLMTVKGVGSIEEADTLRGKVLYIDRDNVKLDEGEHFVQDIIGLEVTDIDSGEVYGTVKDVLKTGSNDVYEMENAEKKRFYIPVIPDIVIDHDFDKGAVFIRPMKGLFDDED